MSKSVKPALRLGRVQHNENELFGVRFTVWWNAKPYTLFWVPGSIERLFRVRHDSDKYRVLGEYQSRIFQSTEYLKQFWNSAAIQETVDFWRIADSVIDQPDSCS